jgi:integrase
MSSRRPKGEGSIFQRPDGRWVGRLTYEDPVTGLRKQSQVSAASKKGASERLRELRDRVKAGAPPRDDKALLGAFAEQWISSTLAVSGRRQSTKSLYASLTRSHLAGSHLGNLPMNRVTPTAVERWLTELRKRGLAESTVRTTYTVARAVGDAAVRDGLIGRNPFAVIKRPKVEQREAAHLTVEQFRALQSALADSRYAPLVEILGHTGLRRGEALALHWRDVDLDERLVRVRGTLARVGGELVVTAPKSKKSTRSVP